MLEIAEGLGDVVAGMAQLERMRGSRNVAAVLKVRLASIRTQAADALVFVVEGPEDKTVYYHWLRQIAPLLQYEMLICNGKGKLLAFRELLHRDLSGSQQGVYFLVDNDFDGLRSQAAGSDVYVTDTYSIENHLVNEQVLDHILRVELHCDGEPAVRAGVVSRFNALYDAFLSVTKPLNRRIYVAKKAGIRGVKAWPDKLNLIAKVDLDSVTGAEHQPDSLICLDREPTGDEIDAYGAEFEKLSPRMQYRGKFAIAFLARILQLLADDRAKPNSVLFALVQPQVTNGQLSLDAVASKSYAPETFRIFINAVLGGLIEPPLVAM